MAIHEQNYTRYDGPLDEGGGWSTFARTTFALAKSFTRTKLLVFLLWIPVLIGLVVVFAEYGLRDQLPQEMGGGGTPGGAGVVFFLQLQFYSAALLMAASGCGAIADDLRHQTFQLYFSRPVERWEYVLGKFLGLFLICSLVTLLPAVVLGGARLAFFAQTDVAGAIAGQTATGLFLSLGLTVLVCSVVLGLSSMTRRTGYVVLAWIGVLFVPMIVTVIVAIASSGADSAHLWNLSGNLLLISNHLLAEEAPDIHLLWPILILVGTVALSLVAVRYRVNELEGIA